MEHTYDEKTHDLAEAFVRDIPTHRLSPMTREQVTHELAIEIQQAIESHLEQYEK